MDLRFPGVQAGLGLHAQQVLEDVDPLLSELRAGVQDGPEIRHRPEREGLLLGVTWERRVSDGHLRDDAASRPYVDFRAILLRPQEKLGRSVPERDHVVGEGLRRQGEHPGQAEVTDLQAGRADEDVLRLQVAVYDWRTWHAWIPLRSCCEYWMTSDMGIAARSCGSPSASCVVLVDVLEDQVVLGEARDLDRLQLDDVRVHEVAQEGDLPYHVRRDAVAQVVVEVEALQRDDLAGLDVLRLPDGAVHAGPDDLDRLVPLVQLLSVGLIEVVAHLCSRRGLAGGWWQRHLDSRCA
eukprot:CAMPEP_0179224322 /NCGR_PEP_ID=MMETSP0797-20121207/7720_1 /TAXON_ID=47934 /ORGANISM="Dinophysis acuminata, Strain DAEP01" /LENGTH=294 /DNA_ID=CAMNT_0020931279 /DNA_START=165 /DNA_END=1048 /DNA_ORIENTATION=-